MSLVIIEMQSASAHKTVVTKGEHATAHARKDASCKMSLVGDCTCISMISSHLYSLSLAPSNQGQYNEYMSTIHQSTNV